MDNDSKHEIDFGRLRARVREKPRTKAGQVRQAWPEIKDLAAAGHSLKDIWAWLNESGISIGYARLSHYIGQLRKKEKASDGAGIMWTPALALQTSAVITVPPNSSSDQNQITGAEPNPDPLANVRVRKSGAPGSTTTHNPTSES